MDQTSPKGESEFDQSDLCSQLCNQNEIQTRQSFSYLMNASLSSVTHSEFLECGFNEICMCFFTRRLPVSHV